MQTKLITVISLFAALILVNCNDDGSSDETDQTGTHSTADTGNDDRTDSAGDTVRGDDAVPGVDTSVPGSIGCGATAWPEEGPKQITIDSLDREYIITFPASYSSENPYKVIFAWHGLGGTAEQTLGNEWWGYYGMKNLADDNTIFIAGQGLPSDGGTDYKWDNKDGRDVAYTRAIYDWLLKNYCIDTNRVFGIGFSYGGIMSNTVGCYLGDIFRAVAPMSGSGPGSWMDGSPPGDCVGKVATWLIHGSADTTVEPVQGERSRDYWLDDNNCGDTTIPVDPAPCVQYQGCDDGYPVYWCYHDGDHMLPDWVGQGAWDFFAQF